MFLRALTIRGFKSFADKTAFEFTPGVSVIVGPNGSGKSNIVDAIAWVLGEQGPRALRGGQMTDVIFAGTSSRPALGMAEVRLVIDNSAGLIPVPASEIEISRAVFRSGESEYRIGGRPCRLIDLHELLSDTGIGRALHTIVGQGQLDSVLGARPEERRQFVEEAAGIAKHRRRRERAERKLAGLEQDLLRLQDLVGELRRQLKPLKQQAELARRHEALSNEASELAAKLAAARLRELYAERERRRPSWESAEARQGELRAELDRLDAEIEELDLERKEAEEAEGLAQEGHSNASRTRSRADEALRSALKLEAESRDRLGAATSRSGRLFALEEELERTERALAEVEAAFERLSAELEEGEAEFRRASQARRDAEEERRRQAEDAAVRRAELEAMQRALSGHDAELERLFDQLRDLDRRKTAAQARRSGLEEEVENLDARGTPVATELSALDRELAELSRRVAQLEAEEQGLIARQGVVEASRLELSISPGSEFVQRPGSRPIGLLRDLIEASPQHATALRGALGPLFDAVVYARVADAIADASAAGAMGLTMLVDTQTDTRTEEAADAGAGRRLADLVRPDPGVRALVGKLLAGIYLVTNLAEAAARSRAFPGAQFVTTAGEVVGASFVRTAPGHDTRLDQVRRESASIDRELAAVRRGAREHRQRLMEQSARADALREDLERSDRLITATAEEMGGLEAQLISLAKEEQLVQRRVAAVEAAALAARDRLASRPVADSGPAPLPPVAEPPVHARVQVEALKRERSRLEAGVARARREIEALASEDPVTMREAVASAEESRASAEKQLAAADAILVGAMEDYTRATEAARRTQSRHAEAYRSWRDRASDGDRLREEHVEQDRARAELERRVFEAERVLAEGHGSDPTTAVEALAPEESVEELQRRSDLVARRLGLVGRVNLLATDELDSLRERHDFLVRELEDVKAARRDLQEVIADVDRRVAEQFETAFSDVAREFSSLFELMFPGGEGRLSLVDPGDPLTSGIEVEARPSRGRVKRLSLLSGGERSLAALAFLFAIFRARPSPFYLMDEVEAALDDVNLHRFLELVRAFARDSQILIVSHQKRTMEAADVLYGISMGPAGVSTVISERLVEATASA
jgi:chromosome segregation protein